MERWVEETLHRGFRVRLKADRVLFDSETEHQHLVIFENEDFGRVMMLDSMVQLATKDDFVYHEMMAHVPLFAHGRAKKALIIGGGDGGVLREALKHPELEDVTLCEIDRSVLNLCREHFPDISAGAYDDPRTRIVIADGTKFVAETDDRFDVIMIDSTDPIGPGAVLFTREFYAGCRRCLKPGGILVTQNGLPFLQADELRESVGYFRDLFRDAFAYLATTPSYFGGPMSFGWATDDTEARRTASTPSSAATRMPAPSPPAIGGRTCMSPPSPFPITFGNWSRPNLPPARVAYNPSPEREVMAGLVRQLICPTAAILPPLHAPPRAQTRSGSARACACTPPQGGANGRRNFANVEQDGSTSIERCPRGVGSLSPRARPN